MGSLLGTSRRNFVMIHFPNYESKGLNMTLKGNESVEYSFKDDDTLLIWAMKGAQYTLQARKRLYFKYDATEDLEYRFTYDLILSSEICLGTQFERKIDILVGQLKLYKSAKMMLIIDNKIFTQCP